MQIPLKSLHKVHVHVSTWEIVCYIYYSTEIYKALAFVYSGNVCTCTRIIIGLYWFLKTYGNLQLHHIYYMTKYMYLKTNITIDRYFEISIK